MIQVAALIGWISWRTIWFFVELPAPVILLLVALACAAWKVLYRPFPLLETNPPARSRGLPYPHFHLWMVWCYYLSPTVVVMLGGLILLTVWRVWFETRNRNLSPLGKLPKWPLKPSDPGPGIGVG